MSAAPAPHDPTTPQPGTPADPDTGSGHKPFAQTLREIRNGLLHADLTDRLAEVTVAVVEHDKPGSVTLTLSIRPNAAGTVTVSDDVKAKVPEGEKPATLFFADGDGNLLRRDPRQMEMTGALREVPATDRPAPRDVPPPPGVNATTGEVQS